MGTKPPSTDHVAKLKLATVTFDAEGARALCTQLVAELRAGKPITPDAARGVLGTLRKKRYFELMRQVAEALVQAGVTTGAVRRQYAQALIDSGMCWPAIAVLRDLAAATAGRDRAEHAEARGLLGRAYKQVYIATGASGAASRSMLPAAFQAYHGQYAESPRKWLWHGINAVACLWRSKQDGVRIPRAPDPGAMAADILRTIERRRAPDTWDLATAMEAALALGRIERSRARAEEHYETALQWMGRYVTAKDVDAFELASTRRQLVEVWRLKGDEEPGARLLHLLNAMLLRQEGGQIDLNAAEVRKDDYPLLDRGRYEKIFGKDTYKTVGWVHEGLRLCRAVARISRRDGTSVGTGFLVPGRGLSTRLEDRAYLLTNAHVISGQRVVHEQLSDPPLGPDEARVSFDERQGSRRPSYTVDKIVWESPPWELDATLLLLKQPIRGQERCDPYARVPPPGDQSRVYIIGHPEGGPLSWSIQDNYLVDCSTAKIQYRAPTSPGSSGSPVFDDKWRLIGIHHAGNKQMKKLNAKGKHAANEGIRIDAIARAI